MFRNAILGCSFDIVDFSNTSKMNALIVSDDPWMSLPKFYMHDIVFNLVNIYKLTKCKFKVRFKGTDVYVLNDYSTILSDFINKNLYVVGQSACVNVLLTSVVESKLMKWHNMLGHIGHDRLSLLVKNGKSTHLTR